MLNACFVDEDLGQIGSGGLHVMVESRCAETTLLAVGATKEAALADLETDPVEIDFGQRTGPTYVTHAGREFPGELWFAYGPSDGAATEVMQIQEATEDSDTYAALDEACRVEIVPESSFEDLGRVDMTIDDPDRCARVYTGRQQHLLEMCIPAAGHESFAVYDAGSRLAILYINEGAVISTNDYLWVTARSLRLFWVIYLLDVDSIFETPIAVGLEDGTLIYCDVELTYAVSC